MKVGCDHPKVIYPSIHPSIHPSIPPPLFLLPKTESSLGACHVPMYVATPPHWLSTNVLYSKNYVLHHLFWPRLMAKGMNCMWGHM